MTRQFAAGTPLYRQIGATILQQIQSGQLRPGEQLPSELALCESYGVNRLTLRQAITELQRLGAVEIRRGIGTFVASPPDLVEVVATVPVREQHSDSTHDALVAGDAARHALAAAPLRPVEERIEAVGPASGAAGAEAAAHLGLPIEVLQRLDTVMFRDGKPWIVNSYWFERGLGGVVEHTREFGLVVQAFTAGLGLNLRYRWRAFSAVGADYDEARLLEVAAGTALLVRDGVTTLRDDSPVFYVRRRMRGDTAKFVLRYGDAEADTEA